MGTLSVVATPIGNLGDITLRALEVLKKADIVACEDTRMTKKLLSHYDIHTQTITFNANSGERGFEKIIALLEQGKHVALVSDAGTPGVSDPGLELVSVVRNYFSAELDPSHSTPFKKSSGSPQTFAQEGSASVLIEAIPGPSALAAAISIAGLRAASFTFYGFLPLKKGRETVFTEIAASERASIFYESPHRIMKALESLATRLPENRRIGIFRELTKMYEESIVGSASHVLARLATDPQKQRGEFVVIVEASH